MPAENVTETGALFGRLAEDGTVADSAQDGAPPPPPPMPEAGVPTLPPPMPEAGVPALPPVVAPPVAEPAPAPASPVTPAPPAPAPPTAGGTTVGDPSQPPAGLPAAPMDAPATKAGGWEVDPYHLRTFSDAVVRARSYLDTVQAKVDRMQGAELTPQLGTSPVGQQLAKKFDDRLNSTDGLRAMLTEAMKRMDNFVTSAEKAATAYEELERNAVDTFDRTEYDLEVKPAGKG